MDLSATIAAVDRDGTIARVMCRTCRKERGYRMPKGAKEPGAADGVKPAALRSGTVKEEKKKAEVQAVSDAWAKKLSTAKTVAVRNYAASQTFRPGERIQHVKFGEGYVEKLVHPNKIEVLFQDDVRMLIHKP
jgi:hypothetical protein